MKANVLNEISNAYHSVYRHQNWSEKFDSTVSQLSISDAYEVQDRVTKNRVETGDSVVGYKVGCTSAAIRAQFEMYESISARLFKSSIHEDGVQLNRFDYVTCAIEPEMVLTIGCDLEGADLPDEMLIDSIEFVSPGIELHNFHFWIQPPCIQELICSGGIHAGLVVGSSKTGPRQLTFSDEMFHVYKNDIHIASAPSREILCGPLNSLRWLVNSVTEKGEKLLKGSLVIPGSPTELIRIEDDTEVRVVIDGVGEVAAMFRNTE